jgi:hypothetical protein
MHLQPTILQQKIANWNESLAEASKDRDRFDIILDIHADGKFAAEKELIQQGYKQGFDDGFSRAREMAAEEQARQTLREVG